METTTTKPDATPPESRQTPAEPVTATVIDHAGHATSATFEERPKADDWVASIAKNCDLAARVPVAALITETGETPLLLLDDVCTAHRINRWTEAAKARWARGRAPCHTVVVQRDGNVEMYDTVASDQDEENDRATHMLNRVALLYPENPQIVMVDIGHERSVLTVVGPGLTNILSMHHWRAVHAGYNPDAHC